MILQARVGGKERLEVGEPLSLSCAEEAIRVFDPGTETTASG